MHRYYTIGVGYLYCHLTNYKIEINLRLKNLPPIPGVSHLKRGVFRVYTNKGAQKIKVQPLVGDEFIAFMKVSPVVLRGYDSSFLRSSPHLSLFYVPPPNLI